MPRSKIRFLLLQARNPDDPVRDEERDAFAERLHVEPGQIRRACLLTENVDMRTLQGADMLLVGGSGEYSVLDDHDGIRAAKDFLAEVADRGFPTFASCFGFQLMVEGLGGRVITDEPNAEVGTYQLSVTEHGANDPLFGRLPIHFQAQLGHKDRAEVMPEVVVNLARSARVPYQALRVANKPVYAAQFHPELSYARNRGRLERYFDYYSYVFGDHEARRMLEEDFRPSPEASELLDRYVRIFLLDEDPAR
ncbi:MAG: type 1 glutamine amidotransferase [Alphaproteobacteria bacterium]|nr:type 1 glutamine amidotransferase [Alphaproteobacteria bacterium]